MPFPQTVDERYMVDPTFRHVVDYLEAVIGAAQLSPLEVRQAAMLAAIRYEMRQPRRPLFIPIADIRKWFEPDMQVQRCDGRHGGLSCPDPQCWKLR